MTRSLLCNSIEPVLPNRCSFVFSSYSRSPQSSSWPLSGVHSRCPLNDQASQRNFWIFPKKLKPVAYHVVFGDCLEVFLVDKLENGDWVPLWAGLLPLFEMTVHWAYHNVPGVLYIEAQVVDAGHKVRQLLHRVCPDNLAGLKSFSCNALGGWVLVLVASLELPFKVFKFLFLTDRQIVFLL